MNQAQRYNPISAQSDSEQIAARIAELMPRDLALSPEDQSKFDAERAEGDRRYKEARFGELPPDTYRVLEQGSFMGWHLELEIDGDIVSLRDSDQTGSHFRVFDQPALAEALARAEIERRHGPVKAAAAKFKRVFGGEL